MKLQMPVNTRQGQSTSMAHSETEDTLQLKNLSSDAQLIIEYLDNEFDQKIAELVPAKDAEIAELSTEISTLCSRVRKLESSLDDTDAYERKDTLILSGSAIPAGAPDENSHNLVRDVFKNSLQVDVSERDISTAHRLGRKRENTADRRSIIVNFAGGM